MLPGGDSQVCRGVEPCGGGENFFVCFPGILSLAFPLFSDPFGITTATGNCPFFVCVFILLCAWMPRSIRGGYHGYFTAFTKGC